MFANTIENTNSEKELHSRPIFETSAIPDKRTYTVEEIQTILGVSRPTVYSLLKKNEFRWLQIGGGKYRISKKSFDEWLDQQL